MRYYFQGPSNQVSADGYTRATAEEIQQAVNEVREFPHLFSKEELLYASWAEQLKNSGTILLAWWCGKPYWAGVPLNENIRQAADAATCEHDISRSLLAHGVPPVFMIRELALIRYWELHRPSHDYPEIELSF